MLIRSLPVVALLYSFFFAGLELVGADKKSAVAKDDPATPLTRAETEAIKTRYEAVLANTPAPKSGVPHASDAHSARGDAFFFLSRFDEAAKEYQLMVTEKPELDASHWRLGIAYFFAEKPELAVAQFEKYRSYDDVDRENGIWRYLSQYKATDAATAQKQLIRYKKDDRQPFPTVYKLFSSSITPQKALAAIPNEISDADRDARLFYTELYIGMHMVVKNRPQEARTFLTRSVQRKWPRTAGYGPNYMWHVGRVQLERLNKTAPE